jgi:hypothetical protein
MSVVDLATTKEGRFPYAYYIPEVLLVSAIVLG